MGSWFFASWSEVQLTTWTCEGRLKSKEGGMGTSNLRPSGQKHKEQPALGAGIWHRLRVEDSLLRTEPLPCESDTNFREIVSALSRILRHCWNWVRNLIYHICSGILLSHVKEGNLTLWDNRDGAWGDYAKCNKSHGERQKEPHLTYMWNQNKHGYRDRMSGCQRWRVGVHEMGKDQKV